MPIVNRNNSLGIDIGGLLTGSPIGGVVDLIGGLFGSGQTYGADFPYRQQKIQAWLNQYGLAGNNSIYVDQTVLNSLAIEDTGKPSPYSMNGGIWQNDIPQYFQAVQNAITGSGGSNGFTSLATNYVNSVKGYGGGGGIPGPGPVNTSSMNVWVIAGVGLGAIYLLTSKRRN